MGLRGISSVPQSKSRVTVAALKTFCLLLRVCMNSDDANMPTQRSSVTLASLTLLAKREGKQSTFLRDPMDSRSILGDSSASNRNARAPLLDSGITAKDDFLSEVNSRLPGPLNVVSNLLVSAESSPIRQHAVTYFQLILIETRLCWKRDVLDGVCIMALEGCLVLTRDSNDEVASAAQTVLNTYRSTPAYEEDMNLLLSPRILSMIEELPALAQRQSENGLRSKLKLIAAFLMLNDKYYMVWRI